MSETCTGEVRDGVIVFEVSPPPLPSGTQVRIRGIDREPPGATPEIPTRADRLRPVVGSAKGLPTDLAELHNRYLHGQPRR